MQDAGLPNVSQSELSTKKYIRVHVGEDLSAVRLGRKKSPNAPPAFTGKSDNRIEIQYPNTQFTWYTAVYIYTGISLDFARRNQLPPNTLQGATGFLGGEEYFTLHTLTNCCIRGCVFPYIVSDMLPMLSYVLLRLRHSCCAQSESGTHVVVAPFVRVRRMRFEDNHPAVKGNMLACRDISLLLETHETHPSILYQLVNPLAVQVRYCRFYA